MKKLTSALLVFLLLFAMLLPGTAFAASSKSPAQLVTNVKQIGDNILSFDINAKSNGTVRYNVYLTHQDSWYTSNFVSGTVVTFGFAFTNKTILVKLSQMGYYKIVSEATNIKEIDSITINYKSAFETTKTLWTQAKIDQYNDKKQLAFAACTTTGMTIMIFSKSIGGVIGTACSVAELGDFAFQKIVRKTESTRFINVVPKLNYAWSYKTIPTANGYTISLLVYSYTNGKYALVKSYLIENAIF
ncbi:MAG TPA: hypothetical protein VN538_02650 [Clostridia bacterium]|jgi:hypothetical protein|nr:hypothetical protein [Clostridia bacterium]